MTCGSRFGAAAAGITTPSCAVHRGPRREAWRTLLHARAVENQCYVAGVNRVGDDPSGHYAGDSLLVDFKGRTLAEAGDREQTLFAAFDSDALEAFRCKFPAWRDADDFLIRM